jgi:DNA repair photolyase
VHRQGVRALPIANPTNPWAFTAVEYVDAPDPDDPERPLAPNARLQVYEDHTRQILSSNDSPDIHFRWSVNPYRGCFHACAYCYARPSHEYLSFGAGTDFDRKIIVKPAAATLLREAFDRKSWLGERVVFSGVTDCYQPVEATYRLTRSCLEVCSEYHQPVGIITKSPLIERDLDVLVELSAKASVHVTISIPFWDAEHARAIEPYVATPQRRMRIIERLAKAGVEVGVNVAPVIPGLNDAEMGDILAAAKDVGATHAGTVLLRLPSSVAPVFEERLRQALPLRAEKVMRRIRETRGGNLYDSAFGARGRGEGPYAEATFALFDRTARRLGLGTTWMEPLPDDATKPFTAPPTTFQRPVRPDRTGQMKLF